MNIFNDDFLSAATTDIPLENIAEEIMQEGLPVAVTATVLVPIFSDKPEPTQLQPEPVAQDNLSMSTNNQIG